MNSNLTKDLRELGDDEGRPLPTSGVDLVGQGDRIHRRRRLMGVAVAGVACAAIAVAAPTISFGGNPPVAIAAASVLDRAAASAKSEPGLRADQYRLVTTKTTSWTTSTNGVLYSFTTASNRWIPGEPGGDRYRSEVVGAPYSFASPADEAKARKDGLVASSVRGGDPSPGAAWDSYPRDASLVRFLTKGSSAEGSDALDGLLGLLSNDDVPGDLRAAAFENLKAIDIPAEVVKNTRIGDKVGLGLVFGDKSVEAGRTTLLLDDSTGAYLGSTSIEAPSGKGTGSRVGTLVTMTTDRSVVDSAPDWAKSVKVATPVVAPTKGAPTKK